MKLYVYYIGKRRDPHANGMADDFLNRVSKYTQTEMREIRPERTEIWSKHSSAHKIFLDPAGREMDSKQFAALLARSEMEGRDLVFLVGGADGIPPGWNARADLLLSLSRMTYPHELARAMLTEQIYRAFATLRGHPYPR